MPHKLGKDVLYMLHKLVQGVLHMLQKLGQDVLHILHQHGWVLHILHKLGQDVLHMLQKLGCDVLYILLKLEKLFPEKTFRPTKICVSNNFLSKKKNSPKKLFVKKNFSGSEFPHKFFLFLTLPLLGRFTKKTNLLITTESKRTLLMVFYFHPSSWSVPTRVIQH